MGEGRVWHFPQWNSVGIGSSLEHSKPVSSRVGWPNEVDEHGVRVSMVGGAGSGGLATSSELCSTGNWRWYGGGIMGKFHPLEKLMGMLPWYLQA